MRRARVVALSALLVVAASPASASPGGGVDLAALVERVRARADAPGALLGVARGNEPPQVVASGVADRESGARLSPGAPFFLGSISKIYTAAAVLRLAEEGRLSLDDPLARHLPGFPEGDRITIRHLLAHTSGLKDFYKYLYFRPDREEMLALVTKDWRPEELLALAARFGRWFEPGTDWDYSSTNYYLLGRVLERASGERLTEVYRSRLYGPLGLRRTWLAWHEPALARLPTGYLGPVPEWKHSEMFGALGATTRLDRSPVEWGAGGIAAPASEAIAMLRGLLAGRLLAPASIAAMTAFRDTPALGVGGGEGSGVEPDGYGLGLVRMRRVGLTLVGHGGLFTGHTAGLWHLPDCDLTIALYLNRGFVDQRRLLDELLPEITGAAGGAQPCRSRAEAAAAPAGTDALAAGWRGQPVCAALHDDAQLRVLRCTFPPGAGHDRHTHARHFGYALAGGRLRITDESGTREREVATGSSFASEGVGWHEVLNVGESTVVYLIVEPK